MNTYYCHKSSVDEYNELVDSIHLQSREIYDEYNLGELRQAISISRLLGFPEELIEDLQLDLNMLLYVEKDND